MMLLLDIVIFLLLTIIIWSLDMITHKMKLILIALLVVIISTIVFYSNIQAKEEAQINQLVFSFKQGNTLICNKHPIENGNFEYENGTQVFVGKKGTKVDGLIVPIKGCRIAP
jgi:glucan phosphoethanolaminetransferase (alkaline phosphatase superfamily)